MSSFFCRQGHQNPEGSNFCRVCGDSLMGVSSSAFGGLPAALQPGSRLRDRYIIRNVLGEGGFGRTYLIEDTGRFDERLVLKEFLPSVKGTAALQKAVELFQREAVTLYRLKHDQIPKFWEIFQANSRLFLVEDFIEGRTYEALLNERIRNSDVFSETEVLHLFRDLLPVLDYLHQEGIIHRDISPDNIILSSKLEQPVLIDMGAAKQTMLNATTTITATSAPRPTVIGKSGYAPDEQMRLGLVAPYSDLYALAVTAIVLMTGKPPNQLLDQRTLAWNWEEHIQIHPTFSTVIKRMLAPRPDQRFQSAAAALQALSSLLPGAARTDISNPLPAVNTAVTTTHAPSPSPPPTYANQTQSGANYLIQTASAAPIANNSGSGGLLDGARVVPAGVKGWSWSAFLCGPIWGVSNEVWLSLLFTPVHLFAYSILPLVTAFAMGDAVNKGEFIGFFVLMVIAVVPAILALPLGLKGNEWAWRNRRWSSVEQFKNHQRKWAIKCLRILSACCFLWFLLCLLIYSSS